MKKSSFSIVAIVVCCLGLMLSFQNCGGDFGLIDNLESPATLAPSEPLELSSDVTQLQMKLNSNDDMLLHEENIGVDVNLEKQNLQVTDSSATEEFLLNIEEVDEIRVLLRLVRKISLSSDKCDKGSNPGVAVPLTQADELQPEEIVVNTSEEKNIILGEYVDCKSRYDLAIEERRVLKRILLKIILKRTQVNCPEIGLADQPICSSDSYLVKKISNRYCDDGYKCVKKLNQCIDKALVLAPLCPPNSSRVPIYDNGCLSGYNCEASSHQCPILSQIAIKCANGEEAVQVFDENKCIVGQKCQKINACPIFAQSPHQAEESKKCIVDGGEYLPVKNSAGCVVDYQCKRKVACPINVRPRFDYNDKKQCMIKGGKYTPVKNNVGCVTSYNCLGSCPEYSQRRPSNWEDECEKDGGAVVSSGIVNGCRKPSYCKKPDNCPIPFIPAYSSEADKSCQVKGGQYLPVKENGCLTSYECKIIPCPAFAPPAPDFKQSCIKSGGKIVYPKPVSSCPMPPSCERPSVCKMVMPTPSENMLKRCNITGGKLVLKKDRNNCPVNYTCEGSKEPCPSIMPSFQLVQECREEGGSLQTIKNSNNCAVGFKCEKDNLNCPAVTHVMPICKAGEVVKPIIGPDGCDQGNKCVDLIIDPIECPAITHVYPVCKSGYKAQQISDKMGCVTGYICEPDFKICPQLLAIPPHCEHGTEPIINKGGCNTGYRCKQPVACSPIGAPAPGLCGDEERVITVKDKNGCATGFKCEGPVACTLGYPEKPFCGEDANAQMRKDHNGCFAGWSCRKKIDEPHMCPMIPLAMPMCLAPSQLRVIKDKNNCTLGYKCHQAGGVVDNTPPNNCTSWFDGCNTCSVSNGKVGACTKKACFVQEESKCLKYSY